MRDAERQTISPENRCGEDGSCGSLYSYTVTLFHHHFLESKKWRAAMLGVGYHGTYLAVVIYVCSKDYEFQHLLEGRIDF